MFSSPVISDPNKAELDALCRLSVGLYLRE